MIDSDRSSHVEPDPVSVGLRADTLAESVVILLVLAALQRVLGFVRGVLVCRWLSPDALGQWDMAFGFLTLAAPLTVLGLPGSFGRYVEYFRQRGQLPALLRRTAMASGVLTVCAVLLITTIARPQFSQLVFGRSTETQLMLCVGITLAAVIVFNFLCELITALRMARITAMVQFFNSMVFAVACVVLLLVWRQDALAPVAAYGIACLAQIVWILWYLRHHWLITSRHLMANEPPGSSAPSVHRGAAAAGFWSRLLPFAAWVWVSNLLYNLFDVVDRYMIVHTSTVDDPLAIVGSYHSSRIVPLLLVSVASLLSTMLLPHLSHDWEAGRREQVSARMNLALKLLGLLLFVGSIAILLIAPILFNVAFAGKFARGMEVFPWTLTYCAWFGLATMAQMYLWCAERARLSCLALGIGLTANVVLNLVLLPTFGLSGAVWATAAANFTALALLYRFNGWLGMKVQRSMLFISLLPFALGFGIWFSLLTLVAVIGAIVGTNRIFSCEEKKLLTTACDGYLARFRRTPGHNSPPAENAEQQEKLALDSYSDHEHRSEGSRPLRVMFIITAMHTGGAETLLLNLLRRLDRCRFEPELCCLKEAGNLGEELKKEIPVHVNLLRHKYDVRILRRLTKLLRERHIDAVITVGAGDKMFWGRLAAWRAGVPVVISALHSTGWPDGINWLNRQLTSLTDAFVAVAPPHAKYLVEMERLPAKRVCIIPNGVDTEKFCPQILANEPATISSDATTADGSRTRMNDNLRRQIGIPRSAPVAGIVALLRPEKNHEMFLRVAARVRRDVPESQFLIVGDGPRRDDLELLATQLGLKDCVHFLGRRSDVPQLLQLLDVFVLTSHNEANPVSILEALATGKPVVSTAVGSIPETVLDGVTGYLIEPGDELTMSHRVSQLLQDPSQAHHLGSAGRRNVMENWSLDRMVCGYEELIETCYRRKMRKATQPGTEFDAIEGALAGGDTR